jgi:uncharacterized protein YpuA (DUF1002 family)
VVLAKTPVTSAGAAANAGLKRGLREAHHARPIDANANVSERRV